MMKTEVLKWLENSKKILLNVGNLPAHELESLKGEILKREQLLIDFREESLNTDIEIDHLEGTYQIIGGNQNKGQTNYVGFLHLQKSEPRKLTAEWVIDGDQTQKGEGFVADNFLVINFSYKGELNDRLQTFNGVVCYKIIGEGMLHGHWTEEHGDGDYLGFEEGRKLSPSESVFKNMHLN